MFEIEIYEDAKGNSPISEYFRRLNEKAQTSKNERVRLKKISEYLELLKHHGTRIGLPATKHIDGRIWELRPTNDRILFAHCKGNTIVLLHHFVKKTKKTPKSEIEKAKHNLKEFLERSH